MAYRRDAYIDITSIDGVEVDGGFYSEAAEKACRLVGGEVDINGGAPLCTTRIKLKAWSEADLERKCEKIRKKNIENIEFVWPSGWCDEFSDSGEYINTDL